MRARLRDAETDLTQTRLDLTSARSSLADHAAAAANAVGQDGAPAGSGARGGAPAGGVAANAAGGDGATPPAAALSPTAGDAGRPLAGAAAGVVARWQRQGDGSLGDDKEQDYLNEDDGDRDSDGPAGWAPQRRGRSVLGGRQPAMGGSSRFTVDEAGAHDDSFDFQTSFTSSDWLQSFDIPRGVLRADGLPIPFTPSDPVHTATFTVGSRDELEARHWYCTLAWLQSILNDVLAAHHAPDNSREFLEELVDFLVCFVRRVYALGVSRYDYLALRQSEPNLADAFAHADAVPRNSLRGDGARRFISRVVRAEAAA